MRKGGGKQKGNSFERYISKVLSLWLTNNEVDNAIWRTDISGGRSTIKIKNNNINDVVKYNVGDVKQVLDKGRYDNLDNFFNLFFIELKNGYSDSFLFGLPLNKNLIEILNKCIQQSEIVDKNICLIVKSDRKKEMLITNYKLNNLENQLIFKHKGFYFNVYLFEEILTKNFKEII